MSRPKPKGTKAPKRRKRLSAWVDEVIAIKAAQSAKGRQITVGDVIQEALEAHLSGCYWVDPRRPSSEPPPAASAAA